MVDIHTGRESGAIGVEVLVRIELDDDDDERYEIARTDPAFRSLFRHWRAFDATRVLVGKDPGEHVGEPEWWHGGSSVLLEVAPSSYVFIGETIFGFDTDPGESIVEFSSRMGSNDVPYPVAVGTENTYLPIERTFIPNNLLNNRQDPRMFFKYDSLSGRKYQAVERRDRRREWMRAHELRNYVQLHGRWPSETGKPSDYAVYVKKKWPEMRRKHPGKSAVEVMKLIASEWMESRKAKGS